MTRSAVTIGELRDRLSAYLRRVRRGEEIVVRDRKVPVARIVPYDLTPDDDAALRSLVADGILRAPLSDDRDAFLKIPAPKVAGNALLEALLANREEDPER